MNSLVLLSAIVGGFSGLLGIPSLWILLRNARRESQELRDKPLLERLAEMRADRDYWRDKCDDLESRMQGRTGQ